MRSTVITDLRTSWFREKNYIVLVDANKVKIFSELVYDKKTKQFKENSRKEIKYSQLEECYVEKPVVNSFRVEIGLLNRNIMDGGLLDNGLICLATTSAFLVLDKDYSIIQILVYKRFLGPTYKIFGQSLCC